MDTTYGYGDGAFGEDSGYFGQQSIVITMGAPAYGLVTGTFIDPKGQVPVPAAGTVTFTPEMTIRFADVPVTVVPKVETVTLDDGGTLGSGIWLAIGSYRVTFSLSLAVPAYRILVASSNTADNPLDLTLAAPIIPAPGQKLVVNEQLYLDTISARDEAEASAESVFNVLDGMRLEKISQEDYDALPVKDPNTIYVVLQSD